MSTLDCSETAMRATRVQVCGDRLTVELTRTVERSPCCWTGIRGSLKVKRTNERTINSSGKAAELLLKSKQIVPEWLLTNWHFAGMLDALGRHEEALELFMWLLSSKKTADDDPCWESAEWTDALKTDCVFSIGLCHRNAGNPAKAVQCFCEYIRLLANGMPGSYPVDEVIGQLSAVQPSNTQSRKAELRKAAKSIRRKVEELLPA